MAKCGMARLRVSIVFESGARIGLGNAKLGSAVVLEYLYYSHDLFSFEYIPTK